MKISWAHTMLVLLLVLACGAAADDHGQIESREIPEKGGEVLMAYGITIAEDMDMVATVITKLRGKPIAPDVAAGWGEHNGAQFHIVTQQYLRELTGCKKIDWKIDGVDFSYPLSVEIGTHDIGDVAEGAFKMPYSALERVQAAKSVNGSVCGIPIALSPTQIATLRDFYKRAGIPEARAASGHDN